jgi:hypothetical protein
MPPEPPPAGLAAETAPYPSADFRDGYAEGENVLTLRQRRLGVPATRAWAQEILNDGLPRTPYNAGLYEACREYLEENPTDE